MKCKYQVTALGALLLILASASAFISAPAASAADTEKAPSPQLVISFERGTLREDDQLPIRVFLSNPSDKDLNNVTLAWSGLPGTLTLYAETCDQLAADVKKVPKEDHPAANIAVGKLPAQQDSQSIRSLDLCLTSSTVTNGDYNLLFNLRFDWAAKEGTRHSVLTVEKPIKSAFLGTDSLAGVPLALAGFIVPGLLFWLALDAFKTPWRIQGPTLGDKTVYSVLVSLLLVALVSVFPALKEAFDITKGLSLRKLEYLALLGGVTGIAVGWVDRKIRSIRTRNGLQTSDDDTTLLLKLLKLNIGRSKPKTTVNLKSGESFEGSVGGQSATDTFLVGWYQILPNPKRPDETKEIRSAIHRGDMVHAAELAQKYKFEFETQDFLYQQEKNGAFGPTKLMRIHWSNSDVEGKPTVEATEDRSEPLTMN